MGQANANPGTGPRWLVVSRTLRFRLLCLLCLCPLLLGAAPVVLDTSPEQSLAGSLSYFVEGDQPLSIDDVAGVELEDQWQALPDSGANFGYTRDIIWYRVTLTNPAPEAMERLLEINYPLLDDIQFYQLSPDGQLLQQVTTGDSHAHNSRPIAVRTFVFPVIVPAESDTGIYMRVQTTGSHQMPVNLWRASAFYEANEKDIIGRGMFYGMLLVMVGFNLFLFFAMRERSFLYYVFTTGTLLVLMAGLHGTGFQYLYPQLPGLHERIILITSPLLLLFFCLFSNQFLMLRETLPSGHQLMRILVVISTIILILSMVLPYNIATRMAVMLAIPVCVSMLVVGGILWRRGDPSGRYFITAWIALLLGGIVWVATLMGVLPSIQLTQYGIETGAVLQGILLSFALGDRFNRERDARLQEQRARIEAMRQRELAEQRVLEGARHHNLTGLPNRVFLESCLKEELASVSRQGKGSLALVLLHFRGFDDINKTLGHENADQLLCRLATRMNEIVLSLKGSVIIESDGNREYAAAHVEGITFACAFRPESQEDVIAEMSQLVEGLRQPIDFKGLNLDMRLVGGCSFYPDDSDNVATLLRHAFIAFDQADSDVSHVAVYHPDTNPYSERRLTLMTELRRAITEDTLNLHFQPQINVRESAVCGFEVLLRWQHPEYGFIPPDEFIPMAEQTGLIEPLTAWVLDRALRFCKELEVGGMPVRISVNISAMNLREPRFAENIAALLQTHDIPSSRLILEVTETATMIDPKSALKALRVLFDAGIRLSIDDFGTGYSSLSYIRKLPVHEIKIDRSFVMEMDRNREDATIVRTTINMCHDLGFEVVAEGVETQDTCELLKAMQCDIMQGYHLARPMPFEQVPAWITEFRRLADGAK